jgi:hypothetical protein
MAGCVSKPSAAEQTFLRHLKERMADGESRCIVSRNYGASALNFESQTIFGSRPRNSGLSGTIATLTETSGCVMIGEPLGQHRGICMRIFFAAATIALLVAPAYAQLNGGKAPPGAPPAPPKSQQELNAERDAEQAYKKSLSGIPDKPAPDPWGIAREPKTPELR